MELENNTSEVSIEVQESSLNKVTPLSKYLALALFVLLPFIGGWIGYMYAPEKVVETIVMKDTIRGIEGEDKVNTQIEYIDTFSKSKPNSPSGLIFADIVTSPSKEKIYFVRLPWEGFSYSQLYYRDKYDVWAGSPYQAVSGNYALSIPNMHPEQSDPYRTASSGTLYWLSSPSEKYLAVVGATDGSLPLCFDQGMGNIRKVDDMVYIVTQDTAEVAVLVYSKIDPLVSYQIVNWNGDDTITLLKRTYKQNSEKEVTYDYETKTHPERTVACAGDTISEEKVSFSIANDFKSLSEVILGNI